MRKIKFLQNRVLTLGRVVSDKEGVLLASQYL